VGALPEPGALPVPASAVPAVEVQSAAARLRWAMVAVSAAANSGSIRKRIMKDRMLPDGGRCEPRSLHGLPVPPVPGAGTVDDFGMRPMADGARMLVRSFSGTLDLGQGPLVSVGLRAG
jgi:hypothetical protein